MSMVLHQLIGAALSLIIWHLFIKKYFYTQKNREDIEDEVHKWISKL